MIEPSPYQFTDDADFDAILWQCIQTLKVKGKDYAVGSDDKLANFKKVAEFTGVPKEAVLGTYFYKHVASIFSYIKGGHESEPIEGRITDCINYLLLFAKMVAENKNAAIEFDLFRGKADFSNNSNSLK